MREQQQIKKIKNPVLENYTGYIISARITNLAHESTGLLQVS